MVVGRTPSFFLREGGSCRAKYNSEYMSDFSRLVTVFRAIIEGQSPRGRPSFFRMFGGVPRTLPEKFAIEKVL